MSLNPKQVTARPMGLSARTLVLPLVLSLAVVAIPDIAPAGIFDFLKRDRDEDVEIIETHASNCRCRPRCSHPKQSQNQHTTPQTAHRTTPQPTPQFSPKPTPQATSPYAPLATTTPIPSQAFLPPPVFQSAASPPPAPSAPPVAAAIPSTRTPVARYAMRPTPGVPYPSTPVRPIAPPVIYQRETVVKHVPVTTWQTRWVDRGSYRMVWVSQPTLQRVPQTTYRSVLGYRVVPYQRMATSTPGVSARGTTGPVLPPTVGLTPNPVETRPVTSRRAIPSKMKPNTAQRVWQARGRLGR